VTAALRADPVARLATLAPTISVGILTADLMALGTDLARLDGTGVEMLHVDAMDGCFTPTVHESCDHVHRVLQQLGAMANANDAAGMGVDVVVTGSAVFDGKAPADNARHILAALGAR
jgi:pentose-5-phosphate-3-epimerase